MRSGRPRPSRTSPRTGSPRRRRRRRRAARLRHRVRQLHDVAGHALDVRERDLRRVLTGGRLGLTRFAAGHRPGVRPPHLGDVGVAGPEEEQPLLVVGAVRRRPRTLRRRLAHLTLVDGDGEGAPGGVDQALHLPLVPQRHREPDGHAGHDGGAVRGEAHAEVLRRARRRSGIRVHGGRRVLLGRDDRHSDRGHVTAAPTPPTTRTASTAITRPNRRGRPLTGDSSPSCPCGRSARSGALTTC